MAVAGPRSGAHVSGLGNLQHGASRKLGDRQRQRPLQSTEKEAGGLDIETAPNCYEGTHGLKLACIYCYLEKMARCGRKYYL